MILASGYAVSPVFAGCLSKSDDQVPEQFQLSEDGSGRATGYAEANKIVTADGNTHVAWLDSIEKGFRVRIRTLNRSNGSWSETYTIGEAYDNHGGPALTIDSEGYLHAAYYPHHHPMRYRKSVNPHDASEWTEPESIGEQTTYPTLVCGSDNTLYLSCRESATDRWKVDLYRKSATELGHWEGPQTLIQARKPGYAHFQEALSWGPEHQKLHLTSRIHEQRNENDPPQETLIYLESPDGGRTWYGYRGAVLDLPVTADRADKLIEGGRREDEPSIRCGNLAIDSNGTSYTVYSMDTETYLAWLENDTWVRRSLNKILRKEQQELGLTLPGNISINDRNQWIVVATTGEFEAAEQDTIWGHPRSEIVIFRGSTQDKTGHIENRIVSQKQEDVANWLPNVEHDTGHHTVPDQLGAIYTSGPPGDENDDILSNNVIWQR